jgi:hypothetical protein
MLWTIITDIFGVALAIALFYTAWTLLLEGEKMKDEERQDKD